MINANYLFKKILIFKIMIKIQKENFSFQIYLFNARKYFFKINPKNIENNIILYFLKFGKNIYKDIKKKFLYNNKNDPNNKL